MVQTADTIPAKLALAIRRVTDARQIILFGSHARGDARPTSDYDLLVVSDRAVWQKPSRRLESVRLQDALPRTEVGVDLLLCTPDEFARWKDSLNHVVGRATREGVALYERA